MRQESALPLLEARGPGRQYLLGLALFLAFLALLLLTVVEMRRGFWLPRADYFTIGAPSPILYWNFRHLLPLALGVLGAWLTYRHLRRLEVRLRGGMLKPLAAVTAAAVLAMLVADLLIYRGVPAWRIAAAGAMGVGEAIPLAGFPRWLRPVGEGLNYMALTWHATALAVLLGALLLTVVAPTLKRVVRGNGLASHMAGAALAMPLPFCSCCATPIGAAMYRRGASLGPTLAFVVSSPMLNITTLVLASLLLPLPFALLRIGGGILVGILLTYAVAVVAARWARPEAVTPRPGRLTSWFLKGLNSYCRLWQLEGPPQPGPLGAPSALLADWLAMAWRLGRVVIPILLVGSVVTAALVTALPYPGNDLPGVVSAAAFGTLLMIPTWTEIPVAGVFIQQGLPGPAAALLLTLPAVSLPCLAVLGGALGNVRTALLLGLLVFITGLLAGGLFLLAGV